MNRRHSSWLVLITVLLALAGTAVPHAQYPGSPTAGTLATPLQGSVSSDYSPGWDDIQAVGVEDELLRIFYRRSDGLLLLTHEDRWGNTLEQSPAYYIGGWTTLVVTALELDYGGYRVSIMGYDRVSGHAQRWTLDWAGSAYYN